MVATKQIPNVDAVLAKLKLLAAACASARNVTADLAPSDLRVARAEAVMRQADARFEAAAIAALKAGIRDPRVLAVIARHYSDGTDGMQINGDALRDGLAWRLMVEDLAA